MASKGTLGLGGPSSIRIIVRPPWSTSVLGPNPLVLRESYVQDDDRGSQGSKSDANDLNRSPYSIDLSKDEVEWLVKVSDIVTCLALSPVASTQVPSCGSRGTIPSRRGSCRPASVR